MLRCGDEFKSFSDLCEAISAFEQAEFVQLYVRRSRKIESASQRAPKKKFNQDLKYSEIDFACYHGGKKFKSTSTGKRPNQK